MIASTNIKLSKKAQRVFDYMKDFGSITTLEACNDLGETRLSARIFELKDKGFDISFEWVEILNRYKEKCRVKRYYIV
nr:helix-turn-helix domain-containing protein [uncultured Treponema sp.]